MATIKARKKPVKNNSYGAYKARRLAIYFDSVGDSEVVKNAARIEKLSVSRFVVRAAMREANRVLSEAAKSGQ